jgi:hypothetical protein
MQGGDQPNLVDFTLETAVEGAPRPFLRFD